jgi:hypothetical protein
MPKAGDVVAYVDENDLIHDAVVVSVISDGKAPFNALTLRTLDDDVERSNVQHEGDRPDNSDLRVVRGHISAGHWRAPSEKEVPLFAKHAERRAKTRQALAEVDETPKKNEEHSETAKRVADARTKITSAKAAQEPALLVDDVPRAGEAPETTKKRVAAAKEAAKRRGGE